MVLWSISFCPHLFSYFYCVFFEKNKQTNKTKQKQKISPFKDIIPEMHVHNKNIVHMGPGKYFQIIHTYTNVVALHLTHHQLHAVPLKY